jgi:PIN domain nuclease of toxin-antitoxin system
MSSFVLDASAVLTLLNDEPGADEVEARLEDSIISAVNVS